MNPSPGGVWVAFYEHALNIEFPPPARAYVPLACKEFVRLAKHVEQHIKRDENGHPVILKKADGLVDIASDINYTGFNT